MSNSPIPNLAGAQWRKASASTDNGACVEVAVNLARARWRKASASQNNGECVEVAGNLPRIVAIRDSKHPDGPALAVAPATFRGLAGHVG